MQLDTYLPLIDRWAEDRGLGKGDTARQMLKLTEEVGELAAAIARGRNDDTADAVGDIVVVLEILCLQTGLDMTECVIKAYETISQRRGRTVDGVFIKSEDDHVSP